jgi:hypothetical protein
MNKLISNFIAIIICIGGLTGCKKKWELAEDEYIFVEAYLYYIRTIIKNPRGITSLGGRLCCSRYDYNSSEGTIKAKMNFPIDDDLMLVYGTGIVHENEFEVSSMSSLSGTDFYPVNIGEGIRIEDIKNEGAVIISYENEKTLIPQGEETIIQLARDTLMRWGLPEDVVAETHIFFKISNRGVLKKSGLIAE